MIVFSIIPNFALAENKISKATNWLINQAIVDGCEGRGGKFADIGVFIIDLDGDGRKDLVLSHHAVSCNGRPGSSNMCGASICTSDVYLRRGKLLKHNLSFLGHADVKNDSLPTIIKLGKTKTSHIRWNGKKFVER